MKTKCGNPTEDCLQPFASMQPFRNSVSPPAALVRALTNQYPPNACYPIPFLPTTTNYNHQPPAFPLDTPYIRPT